MNHSRDPDAIIAAWLEDGPTELADPTRRSIATAARAMAQRRRTGAPWRSLDMNSSYKLAVGAAAVVAVALIGAYLLGRAPNNIGNQSPTPPGVSGSAVNFARPFDYVIPDGSGLVLLDATTNLYNFEVGGGSGDEQGLAIREVGWISINPCAPAEGRRQFRGGQDGLAQYLESVPGLAVSDPIEMTVDGRQARAVDVVAQPEGDCPEIYLWPEAPLPFTTMVTPGRTSRMVITDVDGVTVVILIWARDLDAWLPTATAFINSIQFGEAPPASSPS
jgi:hypothetical protein